MSLWRRSCRWVSKIKSCSDPRGPSGVLGGVQDRILQRLVEQILTNDTELAIAVPKISSSRCSPWYADGVTVGVTRWIALSRFLGNELVEVPVVVSQQLLVQQNVDFPVHGARGFLGGGGLQGFPSGQGSTVLRGADSSVGLQDSLTQGSPALRGADLHGDLLGDLSGQSAKASEDADFATEDELVEVRHDDWVSMVDEHGRCFFWNRRYDTTHWNVPPGMLHRWVCYGRRFLELESQVEVEFLRGLDGG